MPTIHAFHGTNQEFDRFEQNKARIANDNYGGGVAYFTSAIDVAHTYARSMANKYGGSKYVYETALTINKVFDVNHVFTGKELTQFFKSKSALEPFARGASLLTPSTDKYSVMARLESGEYQITGEVLFKGLSAGMTKTAAARDLIKSLGYDCLRYNGGFDTKHDVYIEYYASNIRIVDRYMFDKAGNKYKIQK